MRRAFASPRIERILAPLEPWLHASQRYLLPVSGAAGLALGGAIVMGSGSSVEPYAGAALVAGGTTALLASLAHRRAVARARADSSRRSARPGDRQSVRAGASSTPDHRPPPTRASLPAGEEPVGVW